MEEKKTQSVDIVQTDKVITIKISGFFYHRYHKFIRDYCAETGLDKITKLFQNIKEYGDKLPEDSESFNLDTIVILLQTMESEFMKQGYIDKKEVDIS